MTKEKTSGFVFSCFRGRSTGVRVTFRAPDSPATPGMLCLGDSPPPFLRLSLRRACGRTADRRRSGRIRIRSILSVRARCGLRRCRAPRTGFARWTHACSRLLERVVDQPEFFRIRRSFAPVARRFDARRAAQRVYFEARVLGDRQLARSIRVIMRLRACVLFERPANFLRRRDRGTVVQGGELYRKAIKNSADLGNLVPVRCRD